MRKSIAVLAVSVLVLSAEAYASRRMGCPHSAAREVVSFQNSIPSTTQSRNVTRGGWAFATADLKEVPGLIEETNGLDFSQPQKTHVLVYESQDISRRGTFWMHEFNNGGILHAQNNLIGEGVHNLADFQRDAARRNFMLVHAKTTEVRYADLLWTNTILATTRHLPTASNPERLLKINEQFVENLDATDGLAIQDALFVTTTKQGNEDLVTVYLQARSEPGKWMGILLNATRHPNDTKAYISKQLDRLGSNGKLYVVGDAIALDLVTLGDQHHVDVIRRSAEIAKDLVATHERVSALTDTPLLKETTVFVNGIPESADALSAMGMPTAGVEHWRTLKTAADQLMTDRYAARIDNRDAFVEELARGENDAVVIIAHAEGTYIYIGGQRVDFAELEKLPTRKDRLRARRAILISCNTADLSVEQRRLFRRRLDTLATIFIKKNLFDEVIAPDHTITAPESLAVLQALMSGSRLDVIRRTYGGWLKTAALSLRRGEA
jgi:hypothetical protein